MCHAGKDGIGPFCHLQSRCPFCQEKCREKCQVLTKAVNFGEKVMPDVLGIHQKKNTKKCIFDVLIATHSSLTLAVSH